MESVPLIGYINLGLVVLLIILTIRAWLKKKK